MKVTIPGILIGFILGIGASLIFYITGINRSTPFNKLSETNYKALTDNIVDNCTGEQPSPMGGYCSCIVNGMNKRFTKEFVISNAQSTIELTKECMNLVPAAALEK